MGNWNWFSSCAPLPLSSFLSCREEKKESQWECFYHFDCIEWLRPSAQTDTRQQSDGGEKLYAKLCAAMREEGSRLGLKNTQHSTSDQRCTINRWVSSFCFFPFPIPPGDYSSITLITKLHSLFWSKLDDTMFRIECGYTNSMILPKEFHSSKAQ